MHCVGWVVTDEHGAMKYYLFVILGIFACSLSQLLLKRSANNKHTSRIYEMINPLVIMAYSIFFCSLIINIWAMRHGVQLKEMAMLESLGYIFVPLLSIVLLKEQLYIRTVIGIVIVFFGLIVFHL